MPRLLHRYAHRQRKPASPSRARYVETLGVILIALLIFAITLARFARHISWRWR